MSYVPGLFVKHLLSSLINNCEMNTEDAIKVIYEGIMDFTDEAYMFRTENDVISLEDFCLYCDDVVTDCFERGRIKDRRNFLHTFGRKQIPMNSLITRKQDVHFMSVLINPIIHAVKLQNYYKASRMINWLHFVSIWQKEIRIVSTTPFR